MAKMVRDIFELVKNLDFVEAKVEGHFSSGNRPSRGEEGVRCV